MKYEKLTRLPTNSQVAGIRRRWIEEEEEDSENEGRRRDEPRKGNLRAVLPWKG